MNYKIDKCQPRRYEACRICGVDADCMYVDQKRGLCNACIVCGN